MSDLNDVSFKLGQIDGKLDQVLEAMKAHIAADDVLHKEADTRIDKLEKQRSWIMGAASVVAVGVSSLWNMVIR